LTAREYAGGVALAELPDMIRGYEQIKLDNVQRYHDAVRELSARLGI
jgi:indolepyruvate ferredoxin oxidoreductase